MTNNPQEEQLPRELTKNLSKNICVCYDVTKQEVIDTIKQGAKTLEEVSNKTYACQGSGCCIRQVERLIELLHPSENGRSQEVDNAAEIINSQNDGNSS